ncbi:MAG: glycine cleavage system protein GcvH [Pseudomonadota bacterium]
MSKLRFSKDHEWVRIEGDIATIGITEYAQGQLGDIVFVELPESGDQYAQGDETGVVESVKVASELYAPITGEVTECNASLEDNPGQVNEDAYGQGWFFKMRVDNAAELDELMDEDAYKAFTEE